jgi:cell division protein FtsB
MKSIVKAAHSFHRFLHNPGRVIWLCLAFIAVSLLLNGSLLRIYGLRRDQMRLVQQTEQVRAQIIELDRQLKQAHDPSYIERQALDRYDLVEADDLVFVFADE